MNTKTWLAALLLTTIALAACGGGSANGPSLEGVQWKLVTLNGQPPVANTNPTATFTAGQLGGSGGCNSYFGSYRISGSALTIGEMGMTEMYCTDPGVMDQETAFLAALGSVASFRMAGGQLELLNAAGQVVVVMGQ